MRLALVYAWLFGLSARDHELRAVAATIGLLNAQVDAAIEADARGLSEQWQGAGRRRCCGTIQQRLAGNVDDDALYLMVDASGARIAGNLAAMAARCRAHRRDLRAADRARTASAAWPRLHRFALPGGYPLLVGRDVRARASLRTLLTDTLAWALMLIVGVLGLAARSWCSCLFRRMVSHVSAHGRVHRRRRPVAARARCPAAATSSTGWRKPSTTCWTASAG